MKRDYCFDCKHLKTCRKPKDMKGNRLKCFIPKLNGQAVTAVETLAVQLYAQSDMHPTKAARKAFVHRNTLIYRLNQVYYKTGLDPFKFYDLVKLLEIFKEEER